MARVKLSGYSLRFSDLEAVARGAGVTIDPKARRRVEQSRRVVESLTSGARAVYGINTGFGFLARQRISKDKLLKLQRNIFLSHAGGHGKPLTAEEVRLALTLRLNLLLKGYSGVRFELCRAIKGLLDAGITPIVPEYGSVGASGDLIPLAHIALGLLGEGYVYYRGRTIRAKEALQRARIKPYVFQEKEGLSFVNGTEIMLAVGGLALARAVRLADWADRIAALSFEGLDGNVTALNPRIHQARGQLGQIESARNISRELAGSYLRRGERSNGRLQDPYSLRCAPQIHGPSREALTHARAVIERELNAVTDNPLVLRDENRVVSGGNFHGQPLALAYDIAAIACAEFAGVSERRLELLCNPQMSGLPAFLAADGGVNSGYMALQYLSASLVNENKVLSHPACTDSIPGNVGIEDYVSMGMTAARKFRQVVENVRVALAAEALAAAQAIDLRGVSRRLGKGTTKIYRTIRRVVPRLNRDRIIAEDIRRVLPIFD